jgi:hypothetical protein
MYQPLFKLVGVKSLGGIMKNLFTLALLSVAAIAATSCNGCGCGCGPQKCNDNCCHHYDSCCHHDDCCCDGGYGYDHHDGDEGYYYQH